MSYNAEEEKLFRAVLLTFFHFNKNSMHLQYKGIATMYMHKKSRQEWLSSLLTCQFEIRVWDTGEFSQEGLKKVYF